MTCKPQLFIALAICAGHALSSELLFAEQGSSDRVPSMVVPDRDVSLIRQDPAAIDASDRGIAELERSGVYMRMATGLGLFWAFSDGPTERRFSATSFSISAAAGGTVANGIVLGGMISADRAFGLGAIDNQDKPVDVDGIRFNMVSFGPFIELYPSLKGGLHFGLGALIGELNVQRRVARQVFEAANDPSGLAFLASGGYEWRLGSKFHLGASARLLYAPLEVDETGTDVNVTVWIPALVVTATVH